MFWRAQVNTRSVGLRWKFQYAVSLIGASKSVNS
jgi:hypothetical protein